MYTITLNDGTKIEDLIFKKNIFWSDKELTAEMFRGRLNPVIIELDEEEINIANLGEHSHMAVAYVKVIDGKYALSLVDIPDEAYEKDKMRADLEYVAMMAGVLL